MNAYNDFRGIAASPKFAGFQRSSSLRDADLDEPQLGMHNARGLIIAVLMSAACWAGVGLAFVL